MKHHSSLRLLLAALVLVFTAVTASAAQQPCIVLKSNGMENQYTLRLDAFQSTFESVQFDIIVDRQIEAPKVTWRDNSPAHLQEILTTTAGGKTTLTVIIDHLRPITNVNSVELADLTFSQNLPASAFSAGEEMIALDKDQAETIYREPALKVTGPSGSESGGGSLGWSDASGSIRENGSKKTLSLRVHSGETVGQDLFRQAAEEKLLLTLDYGSYKWIFDTSKGVSIPAGRIYYDLSAEEISFRSLSTAVEGSDILQLETAYSGALPCDALLAWPVGEEHAGKTVYLSFYNENETRLEYRASVTVTEEGIVELPLTRGGRYVVSLRNVWGQPAAGSPAGPTQTTPPESEAEVTVLPEDQLVTPPEPSEPEPVSSLPPEAEEDTGSGGLPGWALPLAGVLVLIAGGTALFFQLRAGKDGGYNI